MTDLQGLVNKTVDFRFRGADLRFDLSHALFSSFDIDVGTRLLFKAIGRDEALLSAKRVLDLGSGIGVIGLAIAAALPDAEVTLRDRDFLAVAFSERNRLRNKLGNARVEAGLIGAGGLGGGWDFILSNIPAKAGGPVIATFVAEAHASLAPGGRLALVIVKPLVDELRSLLEAGGYEIVAEERGSMHRAFVARPLEAAHSEHSAPSAPSGPEPGDPLSPGIFDTRHYLRSKGEFKLLGKVYEAQGYWGLPDFDTIGYPQLAATELVSRFASGSHPRDCLVINPGMGHAAIWTAISLAPSGIALASRDLLSLVAASENLGRLGVIARAADEDGGADRDSGTGALPLVTRSLDVLRLDEEPPESFDLVLDFADPIPGYDWIAPTWERSARLLRRGGTLIIAAPPTELVRLEKRRQQGWRLLGEKRKKGSAAAAWRRT
ncbi:MAG: methyltransferase [Spirochaetota bacterium]